MEKFDKQKDASSVAEIASSGENRVHRILVLLLLLLMVVEWIVLPCQTQPLRVIFGRPQGFCWCDYDVA